MGKGALRVLSFPEAKIVPHLPPKVLNVQMSVHVNCPRFDSFVCGFLLEFLAAFLLEDH